MNSEINSLNQGPEINSPQTTLSTRLDSIVSFAHYFDGGRTGDTYIGPMRIYREPEALIITIMGNTPIILEQKRVVTDELGIRTRVSLTQESLVNGKPCKVLYRCNETLAARGYFNGQEPEVRVMTDEDFNSAHTLLESIESRLRLV